MLPSYYEVFPLVALEAAAAGLPLLVTPVERRRGISAGWGERAADGTQRYWECPTALRDSPEMPAEARRNMGQRAQIDVKRYGLTEFVSAWSKLLRGGRIAMPDEALLVARVLFWVFAAGVVLLPMRWSLFCFILASHMDITSLTFNSATAVGLENTVRIAGLPLLLLLRTGFTSSEDLTWTLPQKMWLALLATQRLPGSGVVFRWRRSRWLPT